MPSRTTGPTAALTVLTAALLTACGSAPPATSDPATADGGDRLNVVASTNVYGAVASAVGGDLVQVDSLIDDPSADPHSFEATPADAAAVAGADVVIVNGGGYDDFMGPLVESVGGDPAVVDVVELSGLEPAEEANPEPTEEAGAEHADDEQAHGHGEFNEHVWYSLPTVQRLATTLADEFGAADAANAARYTANAQQFSGRIDELITQAQAISAAHPGARAAVTEPVPGYLLQTAGLTDVTPAEFTEAVEEDTDPPASAVAQTLALFGPPDPVAVLVLNAQTSTPSTDQVRDAAQTGGVPVVEVSETLPDGVTDYPTWMGAQIDALAAALNGN
jgi:zinc/manganese transport system substrate-binding protein